MSVGSPTAGTWSSSPWRPDNEFEMDRPRIGGSGGCRRRPGPAQWPFSGPLWAKYPAIRVGLRVPTPPDVRPTAGPRRAIPPPRRTCHRRPQKPRRLPRVAPVAGIGAGGQTPDATQRCFNPECSERIGNSRRTGRRPAGLAFPVRPSCAQCESGPSSRASSSSRSSTKSASGRAPPKGMPLMKKYGVPPMPSERPSAKSALMASA